MCVFLAYDKTSDTWRATLLRNETELDGIRGRQSPGNSVCSGKLGIACGTEGSASFSLELVQTGPSVAEVSHVDELPHPRAPRESC